MIRHYLKIALRQLQKNKMQHFLSIVGIALGMLCFSLTTYYIQKTYARFLAWPDAGHMAVMHLRSTVDGQTTSIIPTPYIQAVLDDPAAGIEQVSVLKENYNQNITFSKVDGTEVPFVCHTAHVTEGFTVVFPVRTVNGQTPSLHPGEVWISESMARKVFGKENPTGRTIHYSQSGLSNKVIDYYTITAVVRDLPKYTAERKDLYFYQPALLDQDTQYNATLLLAKNADFEAISKRILSQMPFVEGYEDYEVRIETLHDIILNPTLFIMIFSVLMISSLVLIAAMINFLKLSIQSFYIRTHELSIRRYLGAESKGLFCLLFSEVFILLLLSALATLVITELFIPIFYQYMPSVTVQDGFMEIENASLRNQQFVIICLLVILSSLICYAATRRVRQINLATGVYGKQPGKHRVRNFLLGLQIFICFLFTGLSLGSYMIVMNADEIRYFTLNKQQMSDVLHVKLYEPQLQGHEPEIVARVSQLPEVRDIMFHSGMPDQEYRTLENEIHRCLTILVSENYADFMQLPIEGRMPINEKEIAVSQHYFWQLEKEGRREEAESGTGQLLTLGDQSYTITGIYLQMPFNPLLDKEKFFEANDKYCFTAIRVAPIPEQSSFYVKCSKGKASAVNKAIISIVRSYLPETVPFETISLKEEQRLLNGGGKMIADLFLLLALISLVITAFGIYSAITLDTQSRQKEVAIRKINGADRKEIALLFGRLYIVLTAVSAAIALSIVYLLLYLLMMTEIDIFTDWLNNPLLWLTIITIVGGIIFLTLFFRIRRISRMNPAEVIQTG